MLASQINSVVASLGLTSLKPPKKKEKSEGEETNNYCCAQLSLISYVSKRSSTRRTQKRKKKNSLHSFFIDHSSIQANGFASICIGPFLFGAMTMSLLHVPFAPKKPVSDNCNFLLRTIGNLLNSPTMKKCNFHYFTQDLTSHQHKTNKYDTTDQTNDLMNHLMLLFFLELTKSIKDQHKFT